MLVIRFSIYYKYIYHKYSALYLLKILINDFIKRINQKINFKTIKFKIIMHLIYLLFYLLRYEILKYFEHINR